MTNYIRSVLISNKNINGSKKDAINLIPHFWIDIIQKTVKP